MNDVLKNLYESESFFDMPFSEEYKALCQKDAELWDKLTSILSLETIDELSNSHANLKDQSNFEWFRRGFHIGALLMMELM